MGGVVFGFDVFDEAVLGEEGFPGGVGFEDFEGVNLIEHFVFAQPKVGGGEEVRRDAVAEFCCFSDIEDGACVGFHEVDAWLEGEVAGGCVEAIDAGGMIFGAPGWD